VKSYEGTESTGKVNITGCDVSKFEGKHVLFVEDIIDTGLTMCRYIFSLFSLQLV
jgi:hypoxanthine phosphoribosyltransferase